MTIKNLEGKRFGRLTVIKFNRRIKGRTEWLCKCNPIFGGCGKEQIILAASLNKGSTTSCGCYAKEQASIKNKKRPYEWLFNRLKNSARNKKIILDLTYEEFVDFSKITSCHYCKDHINWIPHENYNSRNYAYHIDRKDNSFGYTKENCIVCCSRCNFGKREYYTYDEWYGMTEYFRSKRI